MKYMVGMILVFALTHAVHAQQWSNMPLRENARIIRDVLSFPFDSILQAKDGTWGVVRVHAIPPGGVRTFEFEEKPVLRVKPGSEMKLQKRGWWKMVVLLKGEQLAPSGRYSLEVPVRPSWNNPTLEEIFDPLVNAGTVLCFMPTDGDEPVDFQSVHMIPEAWIDSVRPAYEQYATSTQMQFTQEVDAPLTANNRRIMTRLIERDNPLLFSFGVRVLAERHEIDAATLEKVLETFHDFRIAVLTYAILDESPIIFDNEEWRKQYAALMKVYDSFIAENLDQDKLQYVILGARATAFSGNPTAELAGESLAKRCEARGGHATAAAETATVAREQAGKAVEGFQLLLRVDTEEFSPGRPVVLTLNIKNISAGQRELNVLVTNPYKDWIIEVRDSKGAQVPLTQFGKTARTKEQVHLSGWMHILEPGDEWSNKILLNRMFDMSMPGEYSVIAKRWITGSVMVGDPPRYPSFELISEPIPIVITVADDIEEARAQPKKPVQDVRR